MVCWYVAPNIRKFDVDLHFVSNIDCFLNHPGSGNQYIWRSNLFELYLFNFFIA